MALHLPLNPSRSYSDRLHYDEIDIIRNLMACLFIYHKSTLISSLKCAKYEIISKGALGKTALREFIRQSYYNNYTKLANTSLFDYRKSSNHEWMLKDSEYIRKYVDDEKMEIINFSQDNNPSIPVDKKMHKVFGDFDQPKKEILVSSLLAFMNQRERDMVNRAHAPGTWLNSEQFKATLKRKINSGPRYKSNNEITDCDISLLIDYMTKEKVLLWTPDPKDSTRPPIYCGAGLRLLRLDSSKLDKELVSLINGLNSRFADLIVSMPSFGGISKKYRMNIFIHNRMLFMSKGDDNEEKQSDDVVMNGQYNDYQYVFCVYAAHLNFNKCVNNITFMDKKDGINGLEIYTTDIDPKCNYLVRKWKMIKITAASWKVFATISEALCLNNYIDCE